MGEVLAALDWPSTAAWGAFAFGAAIAVVAQTHRHVRRAFHQWRLDRRLARHDYMLREELSRYEFAIGEELDPLEPGGVIRHALEAGALAALPVWLAERHLEAWWAIGGAALFGLGVLFGTWRWLNDPDTDPNALRLPKAEIPPEAIVGLVGALCIVGLLLLLMVRLA